MDRLLLKIPTIAVQLNFGTSAGRAGSPLPAAIANPRVLVCHAGAHGVTRPTCSKVDMNYYSVLICTLI